MQVQLTNRFVPSWHIFAVVLLSGSPSKVVKGRLSGGDDSHCGMLTHELGKIRRKSNRMILVIASIIKMYETRLLLLTH